MVSKADVLSAKHYTTPYMLDQGYRQVIKYEQMQQKEFWRVQAPQVRERCNMDWTQTAALPNLVPKHSYAPSSASSVHTYLDKGKAASHAPSKGTTGRRTAATESTQVLLDRVARLESKIERERAKRQQVEVEVSELKQMAALC